MTTLCMEGKYLCMDLFYKVLTLYINIFLMDPSYLYLTRHICRFLTRRLFKIEHVDAQIVSLSASFGGLLMKLQGEQAQLDSFTQDLKFFMLVRK